MTKMFMDDSLLVYLRQSIAGPGHTLVNTDYTVNFRRALSTTHMGSFLVIPDGAGHPRTTLARRLAGYRVRS